MNVKESGIDVQEATESSELGRPVGSDKGGVLSVSLGDLNHENAKAEFSDAVLRLPNSLSTSMQSFLLRG